MELMLRKNVRGLLLDASKVHHSLEMLRKHQQTWVGQSQQDDVADLVEQVKRLQFDVSMVLGDCALLTRKHEQQGNDLVLRDIHGAFRIINGLFDDLKQTRADLKRGYGSASNLRRLNIDWGRLKKSLDHVQVHLRRWGQTTEC
jgi:hypothetical protein